MPSGKVHHELWKAYRIPAVATSTALVIPGYQLTGSAETALVVSLSSVAGYFLGSVVTPDWDLIGIDRSEAIYIKSVLLLPVVAWTTLYARIMQGMGGHRNLWSHMPLISTFIRLCWITFPLVVLSYFLGWVADLPRFLPHFVGLLVGLGLADTIHAGADFSSSLRRRFISKTRSRRVRGTGD